MGLSVSAICVCRGTQKEALLEPKADAAKGGKGAIIVVCARGCISGKFRQGRSDTNTSNTKHYFTR